MERGGDGFVGDQHRAVTGEGTARPGEHLDRTGEVVQHLEGWVLQPGEGLEFSPVWMEMTSGAPLDGLERYAAEVGRRHGAPHNGPTSGWGSWGHYLEGIDADLMLVDGFR